MGIKVKVRILIILFFIFIISFFILAFEQKEKRKIDVFFNIYPKEFSIEEGKYREVYVYLKVNGEPFVKKINWSIKANGNTGKLVFENFSITNKKGFLKATYYAPKDVDVMEYKVGIIAETNIEGKKYFAISNVTIYPKIYNTIIWIESNKDEFIAGETCLLKAFLFVDMEKPYPLKNALINWKFFVGNKKIFEKKTRTNELGIAEIPFFYSNTEKNISIKIVAEFKRNLTGEIDYEGCSFTKYIFIKPEKPGDFPVVLIHGWVGSVSDALLNFTWWNLTKKLLKNGFKVLDFDVNKPGIQWLTYEPEWKEHHIPWIAAKVCEKIKKALILNGYSPNQTIDIVAHSMGGLIARFMAEHYMADVDYWNDNWNGTGYPWYGDGDADITIGGYQIDDLIVVGTPCHGVPPNINESVLKSIIKYANFPSWMGQIPDMIYNSPFLQAMGYKGTDLVDYYAIGGDIGFIVGDYPEDFDGDGIAHYSDGLCPTESPYLEGKPLYILEGKAWPLGKEDHMSLIAINEKVHEYIIQHLIN